MTTTQQPFEPFPIPARAGIGLRGDHYAELAATRAYLPWPLFWSAWRWTGERRYLDPIFDGGVPALKSVNANVLDMLGRQVDCQCGGWTQAHRATDTEIVLFAEMTLVNGIANITVAL